MRSSHHAAIAYYRLLQLSLTGKVGIQYIYMYMYTVHIGVCTVHIFVYTLYVRVYHKCVPQPCIITDYTRALEYKITTFLKGQKI